MTANSPLAYSCSGEHSLVRDGGNVGTTTFSTTTGTDLLVEQPDNSIRQHPALSANSLDNDWYLNFHFTDHLYDSFFHDDLPCGLVDQFLPLDTRIFCRLLTRILDQFFLLYYSSIETSVIDSQVSPTTKPQDSNNNPKIRPNFDIQVVSPSSGRMLSASVRSCDT